MTSKPLIKHYGKVRNGKLSFHNEPLWEQQRWALEGKEFEIVMKQRHRPVTNDQYAYYFGGLLTTCFDNDYFSHFDKAADVSIYFEDKFLAKDVAIVIGGKPKIVRKYDSLSSLSKSEMAAFVDKAFIHCNNDLHIKILTPEEYYLNAYQTKTK